MPATEEIVNGSIVLIGAFAPATFTPAWLLKNNLIGEVDMDEMTEHDSTIISTAGTQLETNSFNLAVTPTRFQIISKDVLRPTIKDISLGVIQLLGRLQISMVGINFMSHFRMGSEDEYHMVGDTLVPKPIWSQLFDPTWSVGLSDLSVKVHPAPRGEKLEIQDGITVRVQPSAKVNSGVFLTYNNHREIKDSPDTHSDELAYDFLKKSWDASWQQSSELFKKLLQLTTQKA